MPSRQVTKSNYRKAKCCGTCKNEDKRYCLHHSILVKPDMICDDHADDPRRAPIRILCGDCAFGKTGDHTCVEGTRKGLPADAGCYAGRRK